MKDIFIIIPTLNPNIDVLNSFLESLQKEFKNILVYDDGSRKEEYEKFFKSIEKRGIIVLHHYINLGKGRAMKDAFDYLLNNYPKLKGVVTADSDGQHSVEDIKNVAKSILDNPHNLILGVRDFNDKKVPFKNKFGNKTTRNVLKLFVGVSVTDTQTGLRGLPKEVMIKFMTSKGDRFEYETNQLIDTLSKNVEILEIPIKTIYSDEIVSESHFNPIKDSFAIYKLFFKYIIASTSSFAIDIAIFSILKNIFNFEYNIFFATVFARIVSSVYNYLLNAHMVFKNKGKNSFIKYALLCVTQMIISGLLVTYFAMLLDGISATVIKIIVDIIIFIVNFIIQREFIFIGGKNEK